MVENRRKRASGNIKKQIIEAALKVFGECGFERATTKAIAKEAGIAEGTIYNYFSSKKDIVFGFLEEEVVTPLSDILHNDNNSDAEIIRNFLHNRLRLWRENQTVLKVVFAEGLFDSMLAEEIRKRILGSGIQEVTSYIANKMDSGKFRKMNPSVVAGSLVGMIVAFGLLQPTIGFGEKLPGDEVIIDVLTSLILNGIEASPDNS